MPFIFTFMSCNGKRLARSGMLILPCWDAHMAGCNSDVHVWQWKNFVLSGMLILPYCDADMAGGNSVFHVQGFTSIADQHHSCLFCAHHTGPSSSSLETPAETPDAACALHILHPCSQFRQVVPPSLQNDRQHCLGKHAKCAWHKSCPAN